MHVCAGVCASVTGGCVEAWVPSLSWVWTWGQLRGPRQAGTQPRQEQLSRGLESALLLLRSEAAGGARCRETRRPPTQPGQPPWNPRCCLAPQLGSPGLLTWASGQWHSVLWTCPAVKAPSLCVWQLLGPGPVVCLSAASLQWASSTLEPPSCWAWGALLLLAASGFGLFYVLKLTEGLVSTSRPLLSCVNPQPAHVQVLKPCFPAWPLLPGSSEGGAGSCGEACGGIRVLLGRDSGCADLGCWREAASVPPQLPLGKFKLPHPGAGQGSGEAPCVPLPP